MTDINNVNRINNVPQIQHVNEANQAGSQKANNQEDNKKIENLQGHADVVGRSQIQKTDKLKDDVDFMMKHPDIIAKTEAFFNLAYAQLLKEDAPNAYEKAAAMATTFARELASQ